MVRCLLALTACFLLVPLLPAQTAGLPTTSSGGQTFFVEGDVEWASVKLNGTTEPREFDKTYLPRLAIGWNIAADQVMYGSFRYLSAKAEETFNPGVPDLESNISRHINLNVFDLMYRERMGGAGAPFGMDVDMGTRFAWAYFKDEETRSTIAGPLSQDQKLDFYTFGGRVGLRPYWMFDQSSWQMTIYGQADFSWLWGQFREKNLYNPQGAGRLSTSNNSWDSLWNLDLEAGVSSYVPGLEGMLQLTLGYHYEIWSIDKLGSLTGGNNGKLTSQGPFVRLQFSF